MIVSEDSRRPAMNIEQAALLPARSRRSLTGGAALRMTMGLARTLDGMVLSDSVSTMDEASSPALPAISLNGTSARVRRAALHHVLRK